MSNEFYNPSGVPATGSQGASLPVRQEFTNIAAGFALLPTMTGNGSKAVVVNSAGTAMTVTTGTLALAGNFATTGAFNTTFAQTASVTLTLPGATGTLATLAGVETLSNKTLVAPALGTPASGVLTNCTGTAAGLTAGNVTTNANLTGPITSVGNATSVASQTGTGSTFVMNTSPTLVTPALGAATATTLAIGGATLGSTAFAVTGRLLLEGVTTTGATGTGNLVFSASPTFSGTTVVEHLTVESVTSTGATGTGSIVFATSPTVTTLTVSSGGAAITGNTSISSGTFTASGGAFAASPASANVVLSPTGTGVVTINPSTAGTMNNMVIGGSTPLAITGTTITDSVGNVRTIVKSGSDKTTSYQLVATDNGQFVGIGSGGSITIPDAVFSAGNAVSLFNNTTGDITITCSITTAYIAGTNSDVASMTLATRGLATILFYSGTVCVVSGNVS